MRVDRSGPLREGKRVQAEHPQPVPLPALAVVISFMNHRHIWANKAPFPVPSELYEAAETEMRDVMKKRGFAIPMDGELARDNVRHFMLNGTPVVMKADG